MNVVSQVSRALQTVLTVEARRMAVRHGVIQRKRKLDGASLIQGLVFGWMKHPDASLEDLAQTTAACGVALTPQALDQRFTPALSDCLRELLELTASQAIDAQPGAIELLNRFNGVYLLDSTVIALPDPLKGLWPGCGGSGGHAALKLQVNLDLRGGRLEGPALTSARMAEQRGTLCLKPTPAGSLRLADQGYFNLWQLGRWTSEGAGWLMRLSCGTAIYDIQGRRIDVLRFLRRQQCPVAMEVKVGTRQKMPCRLLVWRVDPRRVRRRRADARRKACKHGYQASARKLAWCRYDMAITNLPGDRLSVEEARVLLRARWQVEMLFKLWKSYGRVDESRSQKPWRILAEIYAKLIALVIQHWLLLACHWDRPHRSWFRAIRALEDHALLLAYHLGSRRQLAIICQRIRACLAACGRTNIRNKSPSTYQLLANPSLASTLT
jgi:hypothetical protein